MIASLHYKATPPKNIISKKQRIKTAGNSPHYLYALMIFAKYSRLDSSLPARTAQQQSAGLRIACRVVVRFLSAIVLYLQYII